MNGAREGKGSRRIWRCVPSLRVSSRSGTISGTATPTVSSPPHSPILETRNVVDTGSHSGLRYINQYRGSQMFSLTLCGGALSVRQCIAFCSQLWESLAEERTPSSYVLPLRVRMEVHPPWNELRRLNGS